MCIKHKPPVGSVIESASSYGRVLEVAFYLLT